MGKKVRLLDKPIITEFEKKTVNNVLKKYDFKVKEFTKVKGVYKVETEDGFICLRKIRHGKDKIVNGELLFQQLKENGFINTAKYYKTKIGSNYIKTENCYFYATKWIVGEECNLMDILEAEECLKLLAKFHLASANINTRQFNIKNSLKDWPKIFSNALIDLEQFKKIIERKKLKDEFDIKYIRCIEDFYCRGMDALGFLNASEYYKISKIASDKKSISYDSFYYKNIIKEKNDFYILDLSNIIIDIHVNDASKLIRRLMLKKEYNWDFAKAKSLIEAYNSINKLSKNEIELMLALIIFPHKFWKLGRKRYVKHRNWAEDEFMNRLDKLVNSNILEQKFMEDYFKYIESYK
jgi:CotS family spore coat protein